LIYVDVRVVNRLASALDYVSRQVCDSSRVVTETVEVGSDNVLNFVAPRAPQKTEPQRVCPIDWIITRVGVGLTGLTDVGIHTHELPSRGVVVAVNYGTHRAM